MRIFPLLLLAVLIVACTQSSPPGTADAVSSSSTADPATFVGNDYLIDDQHSYIGFKIKYFGFSPVRGRFN